MEEEIYDGRGAGAAPVLKVEMLGGQWEQISMEVSDESQALRTDAVP